MSPTSKTELKVSRPKKLPRWGPEIVSKSMIIQCRSPMRPPCRSHGAPECPQGAKMAPKESLSCFPRLENQGSKHPRRRVWSLKKPGIFPLLESEHTLRANIQRPVSQQTSQQRSGAKQKMNNEKLKNQQAIRSIRILQSL